MLDPLKKDKLFKMNLRDQIFNRFLHEYRNIFYPLHSSHSIDRMPKIYRSMDTIFYYAISTVCVLQISNEGYKCVGVHNYKLKCGNSKFLNDHFYRFNWLNCLYLFLIDVFNYNVGVLNYEVFEPWKRIGLYGILQTLVMYFWIMALALSFVYFFITDFLVKKWRLILYIISFYKFIVLLFKFQFVKEFVNEIF